MGLDFTPATIAPDAGQIIQSQYMVLLAHRHPQLFNGGAHKGDGRNLECRSAVQRPGIVADKHITLREDGKEFS